MVTEEVAVDFTESGSGFMAVEEPEDPTLNLHSHFLVFRAILVLVVVTNFASRYGGTIFYWEMIYYNRSPILILFLKSDKLIWIIHNPDEYQHNSCHILAIVVCIIESL